jgi:hypothetical protein
MKQITPDDLSALTDKNAEPAQRVRALSRLAHWERGKYDHMEPTIASLLDDSNPMVRGAAIKTLVAGWQRGRYVDRAIAMLLTIREDEWSNERSDAGFALAQFAQITGKESDRIIRALIQALRTDPDDLVQQSCYKEILGLLAPDRAAPDGYEFDRERDVDWDLLKPYLDN